MQNSLSNKNQIELFIHNKYHNQKPVVTCLFETRVTDD